MKMMKMKRMMKTTKVCNLDFPCFSRCDQNVESSITGSIFDTKSMVLISVANI